MMVSGSTMRTLLAMSVRSWRAARAAGCPVEPHGRFDTGAVLAWHRKRTNGSSSDQAAVSPVAEAGAEARRRSTIALCELREFELQQIEATTVVSQVKPILAEELQPTRRRLGEIASRVAAQ